MKNLKMLDLSKTAIKDLPSSIGHLQALENLDLSGCEDLESLPVSICNLSSLQTLNVNNCQKLEGILMLDLGGDLCSLRSLHVTCHVLKSGVVRSSLE